MGHEENDPRINITPEINMLSQLNTLTTENFFVVFISALLFTVHICLFFDISRFQKYPLSDLNYINAGILSALITTAAFYTVNISSMTHKVMLIAVIAFISATTITLTLQRLLNWLFHRKQKSA